MQFLQSQERSDILPFIDSSEDVQHQLLKNKFYLVDSDNIKGFCKTYALDVIRKYSDTQYIVRSLKNQKFLAPEKATLYEVNNTWKLSNGLLKNYSNYNVKHTLTLTIHVRNPVSFKNDWLGISPKSRIVGVYKSNMAVSVPVKDMEKLLARPDVLHIGLLQNAKVETPVTDNDITVNEINRVHELYPNSNGEEMVVSVKELFFDTADIDVKDRYSLTGLQADEVNQHATLIATVIGGGGNSSSKGLGVAWGATLTSSSFLQLLPDGDDVFISNNISVQNHSYGTAIESEYGNEAAAYDSSTNTLSTILHVFSSGNSGNLSPSSGVYEGIPNVANQTGNFKGAKNIITVGAINRSGEIDARSSRGPAYDGRVKPELVSYAPGGTSDAAALVSGVGTLIQQVYQDNNGEIPSSSLVKAILLAGTEDIGPRGIDFLSGYGNLNAAQSMSIVSNGQFIEDRLASSVSESFDITIPPNSKMLKVVLTWNDPAANPGDMKALVNDLDMVVVNNVGGNWQPWVLDASPTATLLTQEAQRMEDHLNTVEFITLDNPTPGTYTIRVSGTAIETGQQSFSIAYDIQAADSFTWTHPTSISPLNNNEESFLRWNNTLNIENAMLDIRYNDGSWQNLSGEIDLDNGFFRLPIGSEIGRAQLRMRIGTQTYLSDSFTISPELLPEVLFNCDDELGLGWDSVPNATAYNVQTLNGPYMETIRRVSDTTVFLDRSEFPQNYFSITPVFDGIIGLRGRALDIRQQGVNCYFRNFNALLTDTGNAVDAILNLSTDLNVAAVIFEKLNDDTRTVIETVSSPFTNGLTLEIEDNTLIGGNNTYTATIVLSDGTRIDTESVDIFLPFEDSLILFPNPISSGANLNFISPAVGQDFEIVDLSGKVVVKGVVLSVNDFLGIDLRAGIYIFRVLKNGKTMMAKKIVVIG